MLKIIDGNIFDAKEKYIVHQCNCVTHYAAGLALDVFKKYPWSDIYAERKETGKRDEPGTIIVRGNGDDQRYVIALLGQVYPGRPFEPKNWDEPKSSIDDSSAREKYFLAGLWQIAKIKNLESIAFPANIGCGIAAGKWG